MTPTHLTISIPNIASWPLVFQVLSYCGPQSWAGVDHSQWERGHPPQIANPHEWLCWLSCPEAHVQPSRLFGTFLAHRSVTLAQDSKGPNPSAYHSALDSLALPKPVSPPPPWHGSSLTSSLGPHIIWCHFWHPGSLVLVRDALKTALSFFILHRPCPDFLSYQNLSWTTLTRLCHVFLI